MTYKDQGTDRFASSAKEEKTGLTGHVVPANRLRIGRLLIVGLCHHRVPVLMRGRARENPPSVSCGRRTCIGTGADACRWHYISISEVKFNDGEEGYSPRLI